MALIDSQLDDPICGDFNDGDWCELELGHDGHHRADTIEWSQDAADNGTVTVNCFDVQLDDGENLKALGVGNHLNLREAAAGMEPGMWVLVGYEGEFQDRARMQRLP